MSPLAEPLTFKAPASFRAEVNAPDNLYATLLWNGLAADTRRRYQSPIASYEYFCAINKIRPWPASEESLGRWISIRASGSDSPLLRQAKPDTIQGYLSALRSYHTDLRLNTDVFDSEHLKRLLKGAKRLYNRPSDSERRPITKDILTQITSQPLPSRTTEASKINRLNFDTAFKVAFAGFFRLGEIVYSAAETRNAVTFQATKLTRQDVRFFDKGQYATIHLKRSKSDHEHRGVTVILTASHDSICPVAALQSLMERDPQPESAPLFRLSSGAFTRDAVLRELETRLLRVGIPPDGYRGHSFRKGAAQEAHNNGLTQEEIQTLGRWSSDAVQRYFKTNRKRVIQLHKQFQSGPV
jgi:hypothetical protein